MLLSLSQHLAVLSGASLEDVPTQAPPLMSGFARRLADAAAHMADKIIVLVLDNLDVHADDDDRLDERGGVLAWLPLELPENVRIVASALKDGRVHQQIKASLAPSAFFDLEGFSESEALVLLDDKLAKGSRTLR